MNNFLNKSTEQSSPKDHFQLKRHWRIQIFPFQHIPIRELSQPTVNNPIVFGNLKVAAIVFGNGNKMPYYIRILLQSQTFQIKSACISCGFRVLSPMI